MLKSETANVSGAVVYVSGGCVAAIFQRSGVFYRDAAGHEHPAAALWHIAGQPAGSDSGMEAKGFKNGAWLNAFKNQK